MKKLPLIAFILAGVLLISGCASGPQFSTMKASLAPLSPDAGRIFFYRTAVVGGAVQPNVKVNGQVVGSAQPKGVFYVDRPPGSYTIETSTEVTRQLSLTLEKGQTRYVRLNLSMGFMVGHISPELVEPSTGEREVADLHLITGM